MKIPRLLNKRGQVWIETVIYTLIIFVMIGLVLSFAKPKIEEMQDKAVIEQSIGMLEDIDNLILLLIQGGPGNKRLIELGIKKGVLKIDGINDKIIFEIEGKYTYSQPGKQISHGNIIAYTEKRGNLNMVTLTLNYQEGYNIKYQEKEELKLINKAPVPYKILISNEGGDKTIINFEVN